MHLFKCDGVRNQYDSRVTLNDEKALTNEGFCVCVYGSIKSPGIISMLRTREENAEDRYFSSFGSAARPICPHIP